MQQSNSHESVTLLESAPVSTIRTATTENAARQSDTFLNDDSGSFTAMPLEDETTIILDRLQDITNRASQLHVSEPT